MLLCVEQEGSYKKHTLLFNLENLLKIFDKGDGGGSGKAQGSPMYYSSSWGRNEYLYRIWLVIQSIVVNKFRQKWQLVLKEGSEDHQSKLGALSVNHGKKKFVPIYHADAEMFHRISRKNRVADGTRWKVMGTPECKISWQSTQQFLEWSHTQALSPTKASPC